MRSLTFLALAAALAALSTTASAQGRRRFVGLDDYARLEARHVQAVRTLAGWRESQVRAFQRGRRAGMRAGFRVGAHATPEQKAFGKRFGDQREAVRAQVRDGKLTREQARTQLQAWAREHRPK